MVHREYQVDDVYDDDPFSVFCEECTNIVSRSSAEQVYDEFIGQMVWKCKGCLSPEEKGMSTNNNDIPEAVGDNQYLCSRCGHAESEHPTHKCIGFAFEADKILGGIYMSDKERAQRLEAMIDCMSETIVELRRQLFFAREETQKYRERVKNLEKMITNKA